MTATETGVAIPEAMQQSGASWRQIHHWIGKGWLQSSRGDQWAHVLSPEEVRVAAIMVSLIDAGISPYAAAPLARKVLNASGPVALNERVSITYDGSPREAPTT